MNDIILNARYGLKHKLVHMKDSLWAFVPAENSTGTFRIIGFEGQEKPEKYVHALDPEGGPFMAIGGLIIDNDKKYEIKSITSNGIFELKPYEED